MSLVRYNNTTITLNTSDDGSINNYFQNPITFPPFSEIAFLRANNLNVEYNSILYISVPQISTANRTYNVSGQGLIACGFSINGFPITITWSEIYDTYSTLETNAGRTPATANDFFSGDFKWSLENNVSSIQAVLRELFNDTVESYLKIYSKPEVVFPNTNSIGFYQQGIEVDGFTTKDGQFIKRLGWTIEYNLVSGYFDNIAPPDTADMIIVNGNPVLAGAGSSTSSITGQAGGGLDVVISNGLKATQDLLPSTGALLTEGGVLEFNTNAHNTTDDMRVGVMIESCPKVKNTAYAASANQWVPDIYIELNHPTAPGNSTQGVYKVVDKNSRVMRGVDIDTNNPTGLTEAFGEVTADNGFTFICSRVNGLNKGGNRGTHILSIYAKTLSSTADLDEFMASCIYVSESFTPNAGYLNVVFSTQGADATPGSFTNISLNSDFVSDPTRANPMPFTSPFSMSNAGAPQGMSFQQGIFFKNSNVPATGNGGAGTPNQQDLDESDNNAIFWNRLGFQTGTGYGQLELPYDNTKNDIQNGLVPLKNKMTECLLESICDREIRCDKLFYCPGVSDLSSGGGFGVNTDGSMPYPLKAIQLHIDNLPIESFDGNFQKGDTSKQQNTATRILWNIGLQGSTEYNGTDYGDYLSSTGATAIGDVLDDVDVFSYDEQVFNPIYLSLNNPQEITVNQIQARLCSPDGTVINLSTAPDNYDKANFPTQIVIHLRSPVITNNQQEGNIGYVKGM